MNELTLVKAGMSFISLGTRIFVATPTFTEMSNRFAGVVATVFSAIGVILMLWGGFNFAMSLDARDNSQKIQGAITFFSGVLLFVLPQLVTYISGQTITPAADFGG